MFRRNSRTHRESYERLTSPRARKLAEGVGLPLPTHVEDFGRQDEDEGSLRDVGGGYELTSMRPDTPLPDLSSEPEIVRSDGKHLVAAVGAALARRAG